MMIHLKGESKMVNSVCVFGDSVTKGVVLDGEKKYTVLRDSFANMIKSSANLVLRNYSRFGYTVSKGLDSLLKHRAELKDYDYIALEFGGNDCDFNWAEVSAAPDGEHQPKTPIDLFVEKYTQMIEAVKHAGSCPALLSLPPIDAQRYFAWISRGLNPANILKWLGDVERIYRWHEMYNIAVCRLAKDTETPLLDISSAFLETCHYQQLICDDGIHPNEKGHALISRILDGEIRQYRKEYAS